MGRGQSDFFGRRHSARPRLELLEGRTLLSTWTVTDNSDSPTDTGSLRYAIANAPSGTTINFASTVTSPIMLTNGTLTIKTNLDIEGPGPQSLTIDGNHESGVFQTASGVTATIAGLTLADGTDRGIFNRRATLTVKNCNIANNSGGQGGGIYNLAGTLTLIDSTVSNNSAYEGGGIFNIGALTATNCTIWGNSATTIGGTYGPFGTSAYRGGGGIFNGNTVTLINCTLSRNSAWRGGGIDTRRGGLTIANTIVAGNFLTHGNIFRPDVNVHIGAAEFSVRSLGYNLIGDTFGSSGWVGTDLTGGPQNPLDPRLATLANYGGPTPTIALLPGSPAIDAGSDSITGVTVPATDQRGKPRLTNGKVDIGAFQSQGFTIAVSSGSNQSASLNTPFAAPLVVSVTSANGEPVQGGVVTFTAPRTGATCTFPQGINTAVIDASGLAAMSAVAGSTLGGPYTVSATSAGAAVSADFRLSNSPVEPYQLVIHLQPSPTATAGEPFAVQPVIYVEDQHGNLVTGDNTTQVTASLAAGTGPLLGTTTVTVSGGVATFGAGSDLPLQDNTAEVIKIAFSSGKIVGATSDPIVVGHASADHLVIHTQPSTATAGQAFNPGPVIYLEDQHGNLVTSDNSTRVAVSLASGTGSLQGTTIVTVSGGVASFANLYDNTAGTITLSFASDSTLGQVISYDIVVNPAAPSALVIHTQPSATATAGQAFATQPVVYELDKFGNLVITDNTTQVTASLAAGTGPLLGTTTVTVSGGVATFGAGSDHPLQDNTAEIIRIAFSSGNLLGATSDPIVIAHASPDHLVLHTLPATATAGQTFNPGPVIYVEDQHGNLVTSDNSTQVAVSLASGTGPLQGTTIVTVSGGVASFANLYDNTAGTITLSFASDSTLGQVVSGDIVVNPAAPSALVMHTQPSATATAGQAFATQPVVYELDKFGNLVITDNTTQVTASLAAGTGPLIGTTTVTVSGGVATFGAGSDHPLQDNTAEVIEIAFSSGKIVGATSDPIVVGHASADHLVIQTQPTTATAGQAFNPGPVIWVEDQHGNLVTSDNSTQVAVSLATGSGPLQGTTIVTVSGGVASFANIYDNTAETITLSFASDSTLDQVVSDDIVVSPAAASALVMHTQPSQTATAGQAFATQPVVYEVDQFGNAVTTDNTTQVTASLRTGSGPLLGTSTVTVSGGIATFTNLTDDKAEIVTLMFTGTRLKSVLSNPITVSPAPASQFRISAPATVSPNTAFTITVTAYDPYWNVATGYRGTVRLKSSDNLAALPGNYTFTASDGGVHTFGNAVKLKTSGMQTLTVRDTTNPAMTGSASVQVGSGSFGAVLSHAAVGGDGGRPLLKLQGTRSQSRALAVWSRPLVAASGARNRTVAQAADLLDRALESLI
jgi:hypothetical protein